MYSVCASVFVYLVLMGQQGRKKNKARTKTDLIPIYQIKKKNIFIISNFIVTSLITNEHYKSISQQIGVTTPPLPPPNSYLQGV